MEIYSDDNWPLVLKYLILRCLWLVSLSSLVSLCFVQDLVGREGVRKRQSHLRRRSGWNSGGQMASAEGGSVPSGVRYGEECPGRKRILAYFEGHRTLFFVPIWQIWWGQFVLASSILNSGSLFPVARDLYTHDSHPNPTLSHLPRFPMGLYSWTQPRVHESTSFSYWISELSK